MNEKIKNIVKFLRFQYYYYDRTKAFRIRYRGIDKKLFEKNVDKEVIKKYKQKWSVYGMKVETETFLLCYNLSGKLDYNIIPENIFAAIIEPRLNTYKELFFFDIKNVYEKWFEWDKTFPQAYFHKIDDTYYNSKMQYIQDIDSFLKKAEITYPIIIKPSKDTQGGSGVEKVYNFSSLIDKMKVGKHLVFQELIVQNDYLNSINPGINSIRTCLYRSEGEGFKVLNNSIRFGVDGKLDNLTAGGIVCSINEDGTLNEYAVNKFAVKFVEHPNSKIRFSDILIPFYAELNNKSRFIANQIPLCNLLSLDMCLDETDNWRCIEINTQGQTIRFPQYAGISFFDKFTEEVISRTK